MPLPYYLTWLSLGVLGLWLGFPNVIYQIPALVLLFPLSLYFIGIRASSPMDALRRGWIIGLLGASTALYWLAIPIHNVGRLPWPLAIPCALAIGAYVGFYAGVFSSLSFTLKRYIPHNIAARCIALACIWYLLEILRGIIFTGFAWLQLSSAFVPWPFMIQAASIIGSYGLTALFVFSTLSIAESILNKNKILALGGVICIAIPTLFGIFTLYNNPIKTQFTPNDYAFIMTEGNVDQNIKWEQHSQQTTLNIYQDLTHKAVEDFRKQNPNVKNIMLVWPETAMPFFLEHHKVLTPNLLQFVKNLQLPLLVGAPGIITYSKQKREIYNRAYLLSSQGSISGFYDKIHLVPFGEYVPSWLLINFLEPLLQGIGNFTPGKQSKPLVYNELALGMLICYEGIFPDITKQRVAQGANILVNISNDGWFGDSSAPEQHLQLTVLRAVEQGRYLVRSTNTGISAIVDDFGRYIFKGQQFIAQSHVGYAQTNDKKTLFFYISNYLTYLIIGLFVCVFLWGKRQLTKN